MNVPTLLFILSVRQLFMDKIKLEIVSCGISCQAIFTWFHNSFLVVAGLVFLNKGHLIISQMFSIGDKSGEHAGQGKGFTLFCLKKISVELAI